MNFLQKDTKVHLLTSAVAGLLIAYAVTTLKYSAEFASALDWGSSLTLLTLGFGTIFYLALPLAWDRFSSVSNSTRLWAMTAVVLSASIVGWRSGVIGFFAYLLTGFLLFSPSIQALQGHTNERRSLRILTAWALGGLVSYFVLGVFKNFHPSIWEFALFTIVFNILFTLAWDVILDSINPDLKILTLNRIILFGTLLLGLALVVLGARMLVAYPKLFSADFFVIRSDLLPYYFSLTIISLSWTAFLEQKLEQRNWRSFPLILWIQRNAPGLLLATSIVTFSYLFGTVFVSPELGLADNYFDTDSPIWVSFLADPADLLHPVRAVHPYALMILRPPVWLLSLLLNGNKFHAVILLNALAGGLCVFLTWKFFRQRTDNNEYALLLAALLGISNAHLLLGVFLESYIFSAAILITSVLVLSRDKVELKHMVPVGVITFGITVTNLIQTCITYLFTQRSIMKTLKYLTITLGLAVVFSLVQNIIQPDVSPVFISSNVGHESVFRRDVINAPLSETLSRANVMGRTFTLFSIVAPRPLVLLEEIGCSYPCFNTIRFFRGKYEYASYIGFGSLLARFWFILLMIAGLIFLRNLIKSPSSVLLQTALFANILFNYILHMNYGDDPLLYSPDWTYALVFFFGLSYEKLARKTWFKVILLLFLTSLLLNNLELFRTMLDAILPYTP